MSDLIWTIDDGLHEITPGEAAKRPGNYSEGQGTKRILHERPAS